MAVWMVGMAISVTSPALTAARRTVTGSPGIATNVNLVTMANCVIIIVVRTAKETPTSATELAPASDV